MCWDDSGVDWSTFDLVLLRSAWDYVPRLAEFLAWCERVGADAAAESAVPGALNTDKHYLADLAAQGLATVPSHFLEPGTHGATDLQGIVASLATDEFVVKPAVGAGPSDCNESDTACRCQTQTAIRRRCPAPPTAALVQPTRSSMPAWRNRAMFFDGRFEPAPRKDPLRMDEVTEKTAPPRKSSPCRASTRSVWRPAWLQPFPAAHRCMRGSTCCAPATVRPVCWNWN